MAGVVLRRFLKLNSLTKFSNCASSSSLNKFFIRNQSNIVTSSIPAVDIPDLTVQEFLFNKFLQWPNKIAIECGISGKKFTYEELVVKSKNLNRALRKKLKLKKGDVVAFLLPNIPEYPICVLGSLEAGLVTTSINPLYTPEEIQRQLIDSNAKALITLTALWPSAQAAIKLLQRDVPILAIKMQESEVIPQGCINFTEFIDNKFDIDDVEPLDPNGLAFMPYSSGTTGLPKGVELSHRNIVANISQIDVPEYRINKYTTETHQDVIPAILPFFHIYGITVVLFTSLHNNCKIVTLPKFTPDIFINNLAVHKPNLLFIVPPIAIFMSTHPSVKKEYLEQIHTIMCGAAPLGSLDEEKLLKKVGKPIDIVQGYGLTETSPVVLASCAQKKNKLGLVGTVGEVIPNTMVKIVPTDNPRGEPLGPNQQGELLIKGPQIMQRYHNKPKETEEIFVDGWLRTGDILYYDENESFYVTDRLKELIKVKGFQVAPAELEAIIRSHPLVDDAAVIGVPHSTDGETPKAFVVPKPNSKLNISELKSFVAERVTSYKQLNGGVSVVESIPKNASGKIMRRQLKLQHEESN